MADKEIKEIRAKYWTQPVASIESLTQPQDRADKGPASYSKPDVGFRASELHRSTSRIIKPAPSDPIEARLENIEKILDKINRVLVANSGESGGTEGTDGRSIPGVAECKQQ